MSEQTTVGGAKGSKGGRAAIRPIDLLDLTEEYRLAEAGAGDRWGEAGARRWVDDVDTWASRLHTERLLVMTSEGEDLLGVAAARIARTCFGYARKRILLFEQERARDARFEQILAASRDGDDLLVVISATHPDARAFLHNLWSASEPFIQTARARFGELRIWVLVCALAELVGDERLEKARHLPLARIPVLRPCIEELALRQPADGEPIGPDRMDAVCARIEAQRREGQWDRSDRDLYRRLRYARDIQDLERVLTENDADSTGRELRERAAKLLGDAGPLKIAALYVATFFPDSTLADFDKAVCALVKSRVVREPVPKRTVRWGGEAHTIELYTARAGDEVWRQSRAAIFRESPLCTSADTGAGLGSERVVRRIGFAQRRLWKAMERAILEHDPWIHHQSLLAFRDADVLFEASHELRGALARLLAQVADTDLDELYSGWLWPSVKRAVSGADEDLLRPGASRADDDLAHGEGFDRIAAVLSALLRAGQRSLVDRCLDRLLDLDRYKAFLWLVWRLRDEEGFDEAQWLYCLVENVRSKKPDKGPDKGAGAAPGEKGGEDRSQGKEAGRAPGEKGGNEARQGKEAGAAPGEKGAEDRSQGKEAGAAPGEKGAEDRSQGKEAGRAPGEKGGGGRSQGKETGAGPREEAAPQLEPRAGSSESHRTGQLREYLDLRGITGRDRQSIRRILGCLLVWAHGRDERARPFAQSVLVQLADDIVQEGFEPPLHRAHSPVVAALAEERRIELLQRLLCLLLHPDLDRHIDARVYDLFSEGSPPSAGGVAAYRIAAAASRWMLPAELLEIATDALVERLVHKLTQRFQRALEAEIEKPIRGEPLRFPLRHFYHALCLAAFAVLVASEPHDDAHADQRLSMLAEGAGMASEPVQHKRVVSYLGAIDDALAESLAALGDVTRLVSPFRHDALRARLLRMRHCIRTVRTRFGDQPPREISQPLQERS